MAILEYRAIATKVSSKDGEVYVTSSVDGGKTVRMIFGMAPLLAIVEAVKTDVLHIEDEQDGG
jgi:hypothetical protein